MLKNIDKIKDKITGKLLTRVGASALVMCLVVGAVFSGVAQSDSGTAMAATDETLEKEYPELLKSPNVSESGKSETVYVVMDENGQKTEVTCEEWVKNGEKKDKLTDISYLKNIENVSGNETFEQDGEKLVWAADGNDIRYKGDYEGKLPVDVEVTYYLNGSKVSAKEIAGKEGDVEIHFNYNVNQTESAGGYTMTHPYVVISAVVLSNEHFADVEVSGGGKVVNDGDNAACVGVSMPGMNENLGISRADIDIPREFVIKAYTDKFSLEGTYTIATSGLFADMDTEGLGDAEDQLASLESALKKLSKASDQLVGGSSELADGAAELAAGVSDLKAGSTDAAAGAKELTNGLKELSANSAAINSGSAQLEGAIFDTASTQLTEKTGEEVKLTPGNYKQVLQGISSSALVKAENELRGALAAQGVTDGDVQTNILSLTYNLLMDAGKTAPSQDEIKAAIGDAGACAEKASFVGTAVATYQDAATQALIDAGVTPDEQKVMGTAVAMGLAVKDGKTPADFAAYTDAATDFLTAANMYKLASQGASEHVKALAALAVGGETAKELKDLEDMLDQVEKYIAGVKQYTAGVDAVAAGSAELEKGLEQMDGGISLLQDGVDALEEGSEALAEGMRVFDKTGIKTLVHTLTDSQITEICDRYDALVETDKHDTFVGGKLSTMDGASKIIFKTGEVKK